MSADRNSSESSDQRRLPKQSRSVETRNSILASAGELFASQGYENTTTHQIANKARVSVGALYRYFADKEAILKEVYRGEMSSLRDRVLSEFSVLDIVGKDVRQLVRQALELSFEIYSERPGLRRVLGEQSRKIPELAVIRRAQEEVVHGTVRQILSSAPGVEVPDIEVSAYLVSLFMESLIDDYALYRRDHAEFDEERVIDTAADFVVTYLMEKKS